MALVNSLTLYNLINHLLKKTTNSVIYQVANFLVFIKELFILLFFGLSKIKAMLFIIPAHESLFLNLPVSSSVSVQSKLSTSSNIYLKVTGK